MERIEKLKEFFNVDVNNTVPTLAREFAELNGGFTEDDINELIKECKVRFINEEDNSFICHCMSDPFIRIKVDDYHNEYLIEIADRESSIAVFKTREFNTFVKFWNDDVVGYYGQTAKLPEMNF